MGEKDVALMAHLMRRAGFGAGRPELEARAAKGYEATVEELLASVDGESIPVDLIRRYHHEQSAFVSMWGVGTNWLYRMIYTSAPLQEKMALFWHCLFATGYTKISQGKVLLDQIRMLRRFSMGSFKDLLVELSRDPAMIVWLDNQDNHNGAINENYGRELLELFSMGVGNYSEDDIKECARAFTGWTLGNAEYMELKALRDSTLPYGRVAWHFEYRPEDHDDGEKSFLGETGNFNGEEIVEIICRQKATAHFISRHMYHFFVADEPQVAQWPYKAPRDPEAIETLSRAYFESGYDLRAMLRVLFNSEFFKSEASWYQKVKSPAELVAGTLRLSGEFDRPGFKILARAEQMKFMGQLLTSPPSVEGWHQGTEWIDTGNLVERMNFATEQLGNLESSGIKAMTDRIVADGGHAMSAERLVDACLGQMGAISVSEQTRSALVGFAASSEGLASGDDAGAQARQKVANMLQLAAATAEYQRS
jgi:uncharacterized protein (DUF1800 family)